MLAKNEKFNDTIYTDNGKSVLNFLIDHKREESVLPQLLFIDINMPVMNGWRFLDHLASIYTDLKRPPLVYIISSSIDPRDIKRSHKYSFIQSYLIKPISFKTLETIVNKIE